MVLSVLVGNGAQLCSMVGVTLGESIGMTPFNKYKLIFFDSSSFCASGFPVPVQPRLASNSHDGLLDNLWEVRIAVSQVVHGSDADSV